MELHNVGRRYQPLLVLAVLQLLIISFIPSKPAPVPDVSVVAERVPGEATPRDSTEAGAPDIAGNAGSTVTSGAPGSTAKAIGAPAGDTSHCVKGREFDPAIAPWAPPCVVGTPGAAYANNGGATSFGVTGDTITLVEYVANYGAIVNAILAAQGQLETYDDAVVIDKAFEKFMNKHYVLYGRKIKIIPYQAKCQSVPPDYPCLIAEMNTIVNTYKPFAVLWQTSVCSACYAELARLKVIGFGGAGFSDKFAESLAPYFYDAGESATVVADAFTQFWCNQLSSRNVPTRRVKYAGHQNPAQDFDGRPRELGIIATNDPDNKDTVTDYLIPRLKKTCGENVTHTYFYDQDVNTAARQTQAGIAAMNTPNNPATTVLCLCDSVAPAFLYGAEQSQNYYPENVIASNQSMDLDTSGQSYSPNADGSGSLACPSPQRGCEYDLAFGLSTWGPQEPVTNNAGVRIMKDVGATLPSSITSLTATGLARTG